MSPDPGEADPRLASGQEQGPGLSEIVDTFTRPARSGLVLTKERIGAIAADLSLPIGFAERGQMLRNAFRAAAELDRLPDLLAAVSAETRRWDTRYRQWAQTYPASSAIWSDWRAQAQRTLSLIDDLAAEAASARRVEPGSVIPAPTQPADQAT